jgi:radical SAM protein with 4Fe4S-binding SPASM domain
MKIVPSHFVGAPTREAARDLFAASVTDVFLEIFTYCNRTCWFCPNSTIDRRSTNQYMDPRLYSRILSELAEIDYRGMIWYQRYNEPLADRVILDRIREARAVCPTAKPATFTNGDYLTREYLDELRDAGLKGILIMTYLGNEDRFDDDEMLKRMRAKATQLGLSCEFTLECPGVRYNAKLPYEGMEVLMQARNFESIGTDRGKLVDVGPYVRTSWCSVVFSEVNVDWNGKVVPCCNLRSDAPEHRDYVIDDLSTGHSIFEAYASTTFAGWRKSLFNFDPKKAPCDTCRYEVQVDDERTKQLVAKLQQAFLKEEAEPVGR